MDALTPPTDNFASQARALSEAPALAALRDDLAAVAIGPTAHALEALHRATHGSTDMPALDAWLYYLVRTWAQSYAYAQRARERQDFPGAMGDLAATNAAYERLQAALAAIPPATTTLTHAPKTPDEYEAWYAEGYPYDPLIYLIRPYVYEAFGWRDFCGSKGASAFLGAFTTLDAALAALNAHAPTRKRWGRLVLP